MKAEEILKRTVEVLSERGKRYTGDGERNMRGTVEAFNAIFGAKMTVEQGWYFMVLLKMKRGAEDPSRDVDHFIDGAVYTALAGEERTSLSNGAVAKACGCGQCQMWEHVERMNGLP